MVTRAVAQGGVYEAALLLAGLDPRRLEERYRARELYRGARIEAPAVVRLDGVGWGRRLQGYRWPRDHRVHRALVRAAMELVAEYGADMGYVTSDEASILWLRGLPYGGRVEKLVSVSASAVSAGVSLHLGRRLFMDGRVVKLYGHGDVADYILYRARVGFNNYVSSLYHGPRRGRAETPSLREMLEALRARGLDPLREPWAALGTCIARLPSVKKISDGTVVERRRLVAMDTPLLCLDLLTPRARL